MERRDSKSAVISVDFSTRCVRMCTFILLGWIEQTRLLLSVARSQQVAAVSGRREKPRDDLDLTGDRSDPIRSSSSQSSRSDVITALRFNRLPQLRQQITRKKKRNKKDRSIDRFNYNRSSSDVLRTCVRTYVRRRAIDNALKRIFHKKKETKKTADVRCLYVWKRVLKRSDRIGFDVCHTHVERFADFVITQRCRERARINIHLFVNAKRRFHRAPWIQISFFFSAVRLKPETRHSTLDSSANTMRTFSDDKHQQFPPPTAFDRDCLCRDRKPRYKTTDGSPHPPSIIPTTSRLSILNTNRPTDRPTDTSSQPFLRRN